MASKSRSSWQKGAFIAFFLIIIVVLANLIGINWLGLLSWPGWKVILRWTGFASKTGWDWLQLLIIPVGLFFVGFWLNQTQKKREERITQGQKEVEQAVATDNQRENLLLAYLDKMSELLVDKQLHKSTPEDGRREVARVRTLTVLSRLDGPRKRSVLQFLHESGLINKDKHIIDLHGANLRASNFTGVSLHGADLSGANFREATLLGADLSGADLRGAFLLEADLGGANLHGANLSNTNLDGVYFGNADLSGADLRGAFLFGANFHHANLSGATLCEANLSEAILDRADLRNANLTGTNLSEATLSGAYLDSVALSGVTLDKADLRGTIRDTHSKADEVPLMLIELPDVDEQWKHRRKPDAPRGPLRTIGGPLNIPLSLRYDPGEYTVMYVQSSGWALAVRLMIIAALFMASLVCAFIVPIFFGIFLLISMTLFLMTVLITLDYSGDVFILTNKRIIHTEYKIVFFSEHHTIATYDLVRDVKVKIRYPLRRLIRYYIPNRRLFGLDNHIHDIGNVIVRNSSHQEMVIPLVNDPLSLQDRILLIKNYRAKKGERSDDTPMQS